MSINYKEAVKRALNVNLETSKAVERIMAWDESKTIDDNARVLSLSRASAERIVKVYNLKFKHRRAKWEGKHPKTQAYLDLRKAGWTLQEIAKVFGLSRQAIDSCLKTRSNDPLKDRGRPIKVL